MRVERHTERGFSATMTAKRTIKLEDFYLFENLGRAHLERLKEISSFKDYGKGRMLFFEGEAPESLNILVEGVLRVYKTDPKGNEVVLNHFHPVALIAELANLERMPFPATAVFETDGRVLRIEYDAFEMEFLKDPEISFSMIKSLTRKLKALNTVISQNLTMTSTSKVARFIYDNEALFTELKQHKIASILNITPETMCRALKRLKEGSAIGKPSGRFRVLDRERLREFF